MSAGLAHARPWTALICGVPIDDVTLDEALDRVCRFVERGRATGRSHQVATVNVDFIVNAMADREVLSLLQHADLAVADGMPLVWGSRWLGAPLRERVAGADLVPLLAERCAAEGYSMYLFGAAPGVADRAAELLRRRHPGLCISSDSGPFFEAPEDMDRESLDRIAAAQPDILCVALGHPKQERWIDAYREGIGVPVMMGVGGALDFLTGTTRRAPQWMQRGGVEWIHRALSEPRRLARRYARDAARFGPQLLRDVMRARGVSGAVQLRCDVQTRDNVTLVRPRGALTLTPALLGWTAQQWLQPPIGHQVVIDLAHVEMVGPADLGVLAGLSKRLSDSGGHLSLSAVPASVARTILDLRLYEFLSTTSSRIADSVMALNGAHTTHASRHWPPKRSEPALAEGG